MKKPFFLVLFLLSFVVFSQENKETTALEVSFLRGNVLAHKDDMHHLVNGHPEGVMISFIKKTHGSKEWHRAYNNPDYGAYFLFQDFKSPTLGVNYSIGALYHFYAFNRHLQIKVSQGVAMTTNPYDKVENSKNKAFGTKILANSNIGINYYHENIFKKIDFHAGILFSHYSNGRLKAPNSGINTYLLNLGLSYNFEDTKNTIVDTLAYSKKFTEPIKYNVVFRTGINESPVIRSGQKPFYHIGFYADKRINRKSALQLGTELFLTPTMKEYIRYMSVAYPERGYTTNTDDKRIGIFVGHELFVNKFSLEAQIGYYLYRPFDNDIPFYNRTGMKYYFTKKLFASFTIKSHLFLAEALEFGVGVRL
jgi:hypothetical protein